MAVKEGWLYQTSPYTTDVFNGDPEIYKFGVNPLNDEPVVEAQPVHDVHELEVIGQYYPTTGPGTLNLDQAKVSCIMTNGIPFYWWLGKVSDNAGVKTITHMDGLSSKPRIAMWQETGNIKNYSYGVTWGGFNFEWTNNGLHTNLMGMGLDHGIASHTPTYAFPRDDLSAEVKGSFKSITEMKWNSGALTPLKFSFQGIQTLQGYPGDGHFQDISEFAVQKGAYTVQALEASGEAMYADFLSKTPRDFVWKIVDPNDTTRYIKVTNSDCYLATCIPLRRKNQDTIWTAVLKTGQISAECNDNVANSYYQLA